MREETKMKDILCGGLLGLLLITVIGGCKADRQPDHTRALIMQEEKTNFPIRVIATRTTDDWDTDVVILDVENHRYIMASKTRAISLIHAESCPCLLNRYGE